MTSQPMMPEAGRLAAHVLVDALSVFRDSDEDPAVAVDLALQRLADLRTVGVTIDEDEGSAQVDLSQLAGGWLVASNWLLELAVTRHPTSRLDVLAELREFLDTDS